VNGALALLAAVAALGAGDYPPTVAAYGPEWTGLQTLQFAYAQYTFTPTQYVANDDGTGLAPTSAAARDPRVSPDGRHRYAIDPVTNVLSVDGVATGYVVYGYGVAWSPDSELLAFASEGRVRVMAVDGGDVHTVFAGATVAWVSDDELAVGLAGIDADVYTVRADGTRPRRVLTGTSSQGGLAVSPDGTQIAFTASFGSPFEYGSALYVASLGGLDQDVRRLSPDICGVRGCPDTSGPDRLVGTKYGDLIIGGAGDDLIHAGDGQNVVYGQWGNDMILTGSYVDTVYGGGGGDLIRTGAGDDTIFPGPGRDTVYAGTRDDHIIANDGQRDIIDCGPGDDRVRADAVDVVHNCEHVVIAPAAP